VIGGKLGDDGGRVSVVHSTDDVGVGGSRTSGGDKQTRCHDKQASHDACSVCSRASPHVQAGVDRFGFHVAFAHDAGLASTWSSAVASPLTEKLRLQSPLVCTDAKCEGVRGSVNLIARLSSGTHAISFALSIVIDPWRCSPPGQGFLLVRRIDSLGYAEES
jgi:hypothetical protein